MVIDGLFLRAESRRKAGRVEEAAALYRTVLDLDPANEAAAAFLAATYVQELMPQIPDLKERIGWWQEARGLLAGALARNPSSAALHARMANLILDSPLADTRFEGLIAQDLGNPRLVALRHLAEAMRLAETLPRLGRGHLVRVALLAPDVAGRAMITSDSAVFAEAMAIGREALSLRQAVLEQILLEADPSVHLAAVLRAGLEAVDAVDAARHGRRPPAQAEAAIAAYEALLPGTVRIATLRAALALPGR
jgi:tetratricopeptide (TPR) repeat protein